MDTKDLFFAVVIVVLVLLGSYMLWNNSLIKKPTITTENTVATSSPVGKTATSGPLTGEGICLDPNNSYSIPNKNACKNAEDLGTCKLDLNRNNLADIDDICGKGFAKCCCEQGYENCC